MGFLEKVRIEEMEKRVGFFEAGTPEKLMRISMYQQADLGVSPYDASSLILAERQSRFPYFWCRIFTDGICAVVCFVLGGIVGIGTVVTAFGFGPFVTFFNKLISDPLIRISRRS